MNYTCSSLLIRRKIFWTIWIRNGWKYCGANHTNSQSSNSSESISEAASFAAFGCLTTTWLLREFWLLGFGFGVVGMLGKIVAVRSPVFFRGGVLLEETWIQNGWQYDSESQRIRQKQFDWVKLNCMCESNCLCECLLGGCVVAHIWCLPARSCRLHACVPTQRLRRRKLFFRRTEWCKACFC